MKRILVILTSVLVTCSLHAKTIVFLNGGPGLNSQPEKNILGPYLKSLGHKVHFWNEPSRQRPAESTFNINAPYLGAIESAKDFLESVCLDSNEKKCEITLVTHSYSVHYAVELLTKHHAPITELILSSPALEIHKADLNILNLAITGLTSMGDLETSKAITDLMPLLKEEFNQEKVAAFSLAGKYPALFTHYWSNSDLMLEYFSYLSNEYSFNPEEMLRVRMSMPLTLLGLDEKISVPTKVLFCKDDPVVRADQQLPKVFNYFSQPEIIELENCKHYPHLEKMKEINF